MSLECSPFDDIHAIFYRQPQKVLSSILLYEEQFYNKNISHVNLSKLICYYGQLVEYYDARKDPIKEYFMEKMQHTLSRPQSLRLLMKSNGKQKNIQFAEEVKAEEYEEVEEDESPFQEETAQYPSSRYSISKKKIERATNVKIQLQVHDNHEEQQNDLKTLLKVLLQFQNYSQKEFEDVSIEYNIMIQEQLSNQSDLIKKKLEQRGQKRTRANSLDKKEKTGIQVDEKQVTPRNNDAKLSDLIVSQIEQSTQFMRQTIRQSRQSMMKRQSVVLRQNQSLQGSKDSPMIVDRLLTKKSNTMIFENNQEEEQ